MCMSRKNDHPKKPSSNPSNPRLRFWWILDQKAQVPNLENKHFLGLLGSVILLQIILSIIVPKIRKILRAVLDLKK